MLTVLDGLVTAAYLYPVRNSFAHFVCSKIADELKFFQAKSLKLVFPIEYPQDLIERFVCHPGSGDHPSLVDQAPIEILPEDFARLPDQAQPPRHWVDAHGRTEGCSSCVTRQGRHSKKCCERYWNWIRNQKRGEVPALPDKPEEQPPIVEPNDPAVAVPSRPLPRIPGLPAGMTPTRRCPSCESGMNAPGTRPSAECRKREAEFVSGETAKPSLGDLEDLPVQEGGMRDGSYSPSLALDPVEPADVEMATEDVGDIPMVDVCMAQPYHVGEIGFQWSQFSTMATAMSLSSWIFVVRRSSFGSPVEPCLTSRSGTCQLKEPFWPCRRRFVDSLLLVQARFLPRMWRERVASASLAQGGLPTRKRKLRKVCAPESSPKTLQVVSLPEVWASLAQRPVLRHSGWFLELLVGRGVLGIKPCLWQVWTFLRRL